MAAAIQSMLRIIEEHCRDQDQQLPDTGWHQGGGPGQDAGLCNQRSSEGGAAEREWIAEMVEGIGQGQR